MTISVIIPTFNEEKNIGDTLRALATQDYSEDSFEVLVVDNGSHDSTLSIAKEFSSTLPLRILSTPGGSISAVRNSGAEVATGETLVFLDADCVPNSTWLRQALALQHQRGIWGAHYAVPADATWVGKVWAKYQATEQAGATSFLPAGNLFILREDFLKIGGFNETLETSEDVDLCQRALRDGLHVSAFPQLAVVHRGTAKTLRQFYRQNRWHGKHVLRKFVANLPSLKNISVVALSLYTLVMFWAAILFLFLAIAIHHGQLALIPLLLLLAPAVVISLIKTVRRGGISDAPKLATLYVTYFLARAAAVTLRSARNHR